MKASIPPGRPGPFGKYGQCKDPDGCRINEVTTLAGQLGIKSPLPGLPSLALGSADVSLLEMTTAYAAFLNKGIPVRPYSIETITDRNGNIIYKAPPVNDTGPVISVSTAGEVLGMLEAVVLRGTGASLHAAWGLQNNLAGKTGTTQDLADGWFIGMTPSVVIGVWAGGDSPVVRFRNDLWAPVPNLPCRLCQGYSQNEQ